MCSSGFVWPSCGPVSERTHEEERLWMPSKPKEEFPATARRKGYIQPGWSWMSQHSPQKRRDGNTATWDEQP